MSAITSFSAGSGILNPIPLSIVSAQPVAPVTKSELSNSNQANSNAAGSQTASAGSTSGRTTSNSARSGGGGGSSGSAGAAVAAAIAAEITSLETFSTTIGGKQYSESISQSGGEYTASVPNVAGATATATSELQAEESLYARIDVLA